VWALGRWADLARSVPHGHDIRHVKRLQFGRPRGIKFERQFEHDLDVGHGALQLVDLDPLHAARETGPDEPGRCDRIHEPAHSIASLEQQALTNETLTSLLTLVSGLQGGFAGRHIGTEITAYGDVAPLSGGTASGSTTSTRPPRRSPSRSWTDGNVVYTTNGETTAGTHDFTWDGTTDDGVIAPDGAYQLVVEAPMPVARTSPPPFTPAAPSPAST
jgi:hypothetical protein